MKPMLFLLASDPDKTGHRVRLLVRAMSSEAARRLASQKAGAEGRDCWLNLDASSCQELSADASDLRVLLREEGGPT